MSWTWMAWKVLLQTIALLTCSCPFDNQRRSQAAFRSIVKYYETKQYKKGQLELCSNAPNSLVESFAHRHDSSPVRFFITTGIVNAPATCRSQVCKNVSTRKPFRQHSVPLVSWRLPKLGGAKAADAILKKHPEHGETLCMKANPFSHSVNSIFSLSFLFGLKKVHCEIFLAQGLTVSYLDRKEEAYELVRKARALRKMVPRTQGIRRQHFFFETSPCVLFGTLWADSGEGELTLRDCGARGWSATSRVTSVGTCGCLVSTNLDHGICQFSFVPKWWC